MKKPGKMKKAKAKMEVPQGKIAGSGINKPVAEATIPSKKPGTRFSKPTQKQGM